MRQLESLRTLDAAYESNGIVMNASIARLTMNAEETEDSSQEIQASLDELKEVSGNANIALKSEMRRITRGRSM